MAIRYHFDLYPRDNPKNGARLVRFTQLQSAEYRDEANGTGSGRISLRGDTSNAAFIDPDGLQYIRVVREDTVAATEVVVGGFWLDNGDFELLTERGTRLLTFAGPGTLAYLQRAQMWSHVYFSTYPGIFSADDPIDGVYSADQMETTPRLGYIFWRWMIQATLFRSGTTPYTHRHFDGVQATDIHEDDRTENPLPDLSFGFDGDDDSNGSPWSNPFGDFEVPVGEDMLSVAQRCMSAGLYVSMDPDTFEINAWDVEDHRRTRTGSAWATDVIRFQAPTDGTPATGNIKSDAKRGVAPFIQRSVVLAGGDNTYRRSSTGAGDIAWEGFTGSSSDDDDFLERVAAMQLRARSDATDAIRLRMKLGSDRENGVYLPFEHVRVDDLVTVHTGTGAWDLDEAEFPVAAITIKQRDGGDFDAWVDLGSGYSSMSDRAFQGQVVRSHRHPPNPRLCARAVQCSALTAGDLTAATATNGDVESGTTNWSGGSSSGSVYHGGAAGYTATGTSAAFGYDFGSQLFTAGVRYVLDVWLRNLTPADHDYTSVTFGSEGGDEETSLYEGGAGDDDPALFDEYDSGADGAGWHRARVCWTPSEDRTDVRVEITQVAFVSATHGADDLTLSTTTNNEHAGTSPKAARCDHTHHARSIPFSPRGDITATNVQTAIEQAASLASGSDLPWVNVLDYGADPTGVADSWQAFDDALETRTERSAALIVPPGVYRMSAPLVLGNSTVIFGIGSNMENQVSGMSTLTYQPHSVLYFDNNTHGIISPDDAAVTYRCHHPVIENITVRGGGLAQGKIGIWFRDNASSAVAIQRVGLGEIRNCYVEYWGTGIDFDGTSDSCNVLGGHVHDCDKGFVGGSSETTIDRVVFWDLATGPAIELTDDRGFVTACEIQPLVGSGIVVSGDYNRIIGNDISDFTGTGIDVSGDNNVISSNTEGRNTATTYADSGSGNVWGLNSPASSWDVGGGASAFDDLSDVTITSAASGEMPRWNGSAWVNDSGLICVDPGAIAIDAGDPFGVTLTSVWGIDADDGRPYHDDTGAAAGEEAALFYDPLTDHYTLIPYDF